MFHKNKKLKIDRNIRKTRNKLILFLIKSRTIYSKLKRSGYP